MNATTHKTAILVGAPSWARSFNATKNRAQEGAPTGYVVRRASMIAGLWFAATAAGAQPLPPEWQPFNPAPKANPTKYTLEDSPDGPVIRADADHSMSGLIRKQQIDLARTPLLRWRWRIERPLTTADLKTKAGDDYAARVYVLFDYDVSRLPWLTRSKLALAKAIYGVDVPAAALNYVWDNRYPVDTITPNTYTDRARMVVIESGGAKAGQWVTETRDVAADFRAAFGEDAPPVIAVAIATDTDNTGERATAWYGSIEFIPRDKE